MSENKPFDEPGIPQLGPAASGEAPMDDILVALPEGYTYEENIDPDELDALIQRIPTFAATAPNYLAWRTVHYAEYGIQAYDIGVRGPDGSLIGFGSLAAKGAGGELNDLMVDGNHNGRGIGKAITMSSLNMAGFIGVDSIYMGRIEGTNTLTRFLTEEQGFRELPGGALGRGPNPDFLI